MEDDDDYGTCAVWGGELLDPITSLEEWMEAYESFFKPVHDVSKAYGVLPKAEEVCYVTGRLEVGSGEHVSQFVRYGYTMNRPSFFDEIYKPVWEPYAAIDFDELFGDIKPASDYEPDWEIPSSDEYEDCDGCGGDGIYIGFRIVEDPCKQCNGCGTQKKKDVT